MSVFNIMPKQFIFTIYIEWVTNIDRVHALALCQNNSQIRKMITEHSSGVLTRTGHSSRYASSHTQFTNMRQSLNIQAVYSLELDTVVAMPVLTHSSQTLDNPWTFKRYTHWSWTQSSLCQFSHTVHKQETITEHSSGVLTRTGHSSHYASSHTQFTNVRQSLNIQAVYSLELDIVVTLPEQFINMRQLLNIQAVYSLEMDTVVTLPEQFTNMRQSPNIQAAYSLELETVVTMPVLTVHKHKIITEHPSSILTRTGHSSCYASSHCSKTWDNHWTFKQYTH